MAELQVTSTVTVAPTSFKKKPVDRSPPGTNGTLTYIEVDKMWDDNMIEQVPGPGSYPLNDSIGDTFNSHYPNKPYYSICAKNNHSWSKVYITAQHAPEFDTSDQPGPGHYGPSLEQRALGGCEVNFTKASTMRDGESGEKFASTISPGPIYDVCQEIDKATGPKVAFGKGPKFAVNHAEKISVGPGQYRIQSTLVTSAGRTMGNGWRQWDKVHPMHNGLERFKKGKESGDSLGKYQDFDCSHKPQISFTKSKHPPMSFNTNPGAKYDIDRGLSTCTQSHHNRQPTAVICPKRKGMKGLKPRFDFKLVAKGNGDKWVPIF